MPKVTLRFDIRGWVQQTVDVPQAIIDQYKRETNGDDPDCYGIDKMLEPYIRYDDILDQLDGPERIELIDD